MEQELPHHQELHIAVVLLILYRWLFMGGLLEEVVLHLMIYIY
jgi:hypothetical protein